jgi:hypothetical protein
MDTNIKFTYKKAFYQSKILVALIIMGFTILPGVTEAYEWSDNFDDLTMNESLWICRNADVKTILVEQDGKLNFVARGLGPQDGGMKTYISVWEIDFSKDFQFLVKFDNAFSPEGQITDGIEIGLINNSNKSMAWCIAKSTGGGKVFSAGTQRQSIIKEVERTDAGWIGFRYTVASDTLTFLGMDKQQNNIFKDTECKNFKATINIDKVKVYLRGWSDGANFNASFDDFHGNTIP